MFVTFCNNELLVSHTSTLRFNLELRSRGGYNVPWTYTGISVKKYGLNSICEIKLKYRKVRTIAVIFLLLERNFDFYLSDMAWILSRSVPMTGVIDNEVNKVLAANGLKPSQFTRDVQDCGILD